MVLLSNITEYSTDYIVSKNNKKCRGERLEISTHKFCQIIDFGITIDNQTNVYGKTDRQINPSTVNSVTFEHSKGQRYR